MANQTVNFPGSKGGLTPIAAAPLNDGSGSYGLLVGRYAQTVTPVDQASTASFVDVTGSTLDALYAANVSYTILNNGAQSINWKVLADNNSDFSAAVTVQNSATVAAAGVGTYTAAPAPYRYYKVQIQDTSGGQHGQSHLSGIAKG